MKFFCQNHPKNETKEEKMSKRKLFWMLVTNDAYELPLACERSAKALAETCRMARPELLRVRRQAGVSVKVKKVKADGGAVRDRR